MLSKEVTQELLHERYFDAFNFYFAKPINEILGNAFVPHVITFKDYLYYDDDREFMKRFYRSNESPERLDTLTEYYANNYQQVLPNLCVHEQNKIILKRNLKLHKIFIARLNECAGAPQTARLNHSPTYQKNAALLAKHYGADSDTGLESYTEPQRSPNREDPVQIFGEGGFKNMLDRYEENNKTISYETTVYDIYGAGGSSDEEKPREKKQARKGMNIYKKSSGELEESKERHFEANGRAMGVPEGGYLLTNGNRLEESNDGSLTLTNFDKSLPNFHDEVLLGEPLKWEGENNHDDYSELMEARQLVQQYEESKQSITAKVQELARPKTSRGKAAEEEHPRLQNPQIVYSKNTPQYDNFISLKSSEPAQLNKKQPHVSSQKTLQPAETKPKNVALAIEKATKLKASTSETRLLAARNVANGAEIEKNRQNQKPLEKTAALEGKKPNSPQRLVTNSGKSPTGRIKSHMKYPSELLLNEKTKQLLDEFRKSGAFVNAAKQMQTTTAINKPSYQPSSNYVSHITAYLSSNKLAHPQPITKTLESPKMNQKLSGSQSPNIARGKSEGSSKPYMKQAILNEKNSQKANDGATQIVQPNHKGNKYRTISNEGLSNSNTLSAINQYVLSSGNSQISTKSNPDSMSIPDKLFQTVGAKIERVEHLTGSATNRSSNQSRPSSSTKGGTTPKPIDTRPQARPQSGTINTSKSSAPTPVAANKGKNGLKLDLAKVAQLRNSSPEGNIAGFWSSRSTKAKFEKPQLSSRGLVMKTEENTVLRASYPKGSDMHKKEIGSLAGFQSSKLNFAKTSRFNSKPVFQFDSKLRETLLKGPLNHGTSQIAKDAAEQIKNKTIKTNPPKRAGTPVASSANNKRIANLKK